MPDQLIGLLSIMSIVVLVYSGMHVAVALGLTSIAGIWLINGRLEVAVRLLGQGALDSLADHNLAVIPLFALMGILVSNGGLGRDAFDVAEASFRRIRGGLGIATVAANAVFAATTGLSIASAAVFTRIAVPEMIRHGYQPRFAVGVVAGSSVLGMLIPPSLLFILYGIITEQSIGALFMAGIMPGLLLSAVYCVYIFLRTTFKPNSVMAVTDTKAVAAPPMPFGQAAYKIFPTALLVLIVIGGLYGGYFTPTESGGMGALAALLIVLSRRAIDPKGYWRVLTETGHITVTICILFVAATVYSRMLAFSGLPDALAQWIAHQQLSFAVMITLYVIVLLLLGTIIDAGSIMLITVPVMLPVLAQYNVDLIWFGVVTVLATEIGLLTPPFGISVFVVKSALKDNVKIGLNEIFAASFPFACLMLLVLILVIVFPGLALFFQQ
jgi:tripartite ATP-independent transporter DctM subunit